MRTKHGLQNVTRKKRGLSSCCLFARQACGVRTPGDPPPAAQCTTRARASPQLTPKSPVGVAPPIPVCAPRAPLRTMASPRSPGIASPRRRAPAGGRLAPVANAQVRDVSSGSPCVLLPCGSRHELSERLYCLHGASPQAHARAWSLFGSATAAALTHACRAPPPRRSTTWKRTACVCCSRTSAPTWSLTSQKTQSTSLLATWCAMQRGLAFGQLLRCCAPLGVPWSPLAGPRPPSMHALWLV